MIAAPLSQRASPRVVRLLSSKGHAVDKLDRVREAQSGRSFADDSGLSVRNDDLIVVSSNLTGAEVTDTLTGVLPAAQLNKHV